ncbi:MAG: DUF3332 domain-containing protein [Bacteroidales bacterium]|nr:DUF3332 domain-containing protein [Bacteroidales bacterium]
MKKVFLSLALASTLFLSSCIGSFGLTNKYHEWNESVSNKFVNEIIFFFSWPIPVYPVCMLADMLVLNSIEFWTGSNPVASKTEVIDTENGKYLVESNENGYTITKGDETVQFINENGVWYVNQGDQKVEMFHYVDESHICLNLGETTKVVELSQAGVDNFRAEMAK